MRYPTHLILDKQNKLIDLQAPYWVVIMWKQQTISIIWKELTRYFLSTKTKQLKFLYLHPPKTFLDKDFWHISVIRKEKIYTKLKYSRTPSYDLVSAGVAALFAGFLGFLICEKFGFELLDSGDFFFIYMYIVLVIFILRALLSLWRWNFFTSVRLLIHSTINWIQWVGRIN